jgi:fructokinase
MRLGIDLGGTKIEIVAFGRGDEPLFRRRVPTPRHDYRGTIDAIVDLIRAAEEATGETGTVGMGIPGAVSPATGLLKNANSTWLNGRCFAEDLSTAAGREVRLANDANCFALSEAVDGAGRGHRVVFGVIIGTGTGGGVVVDGSLLTGPNAVAGEWGHNSLPWPGPEELPGHLCYCGHHGCIETFLSGPGFARDYAAMGGESLEPSEIAARAARGEAAASATLDRYIHRMARALSSVINLLDPDVIVLGGGMSHVDALYERVPAIWEEWVFSDRVDTLLVPPRHGDSGGVRGAAWLWPEV